MDLLRPGSTIYQAGPMRNYPRSNFPRFLEVAARLRERGLIVVSPAEHDLEMGFDPGRPPEEQGFDVEAALCWDLEQIMYHCLGGVYMMADWEASRGCAAEHAVAIALGRVVEYEVPKDETRYLYTPAGAGKRELEVAR